MLTASPQIEGIEALGLLKRYQQKKDPDIFSNLGTSGSTCNKESLKMFSRLREEAGRRKGVHHAGIVEC